ncbi:MAG TPA: hypothetical protein VGH49_08475, partial [Xanthobacteraceae bacterium]
GARSLSADDHVPATPPALQSLEIRRPANAYDNTTFEDNTACGPECRAVLAAGRVGWVRVAMLGSPERSTVYRRSTAAECGGDTTGKLVALPASCVLIADDPGGGADLVIRFDGVAKFETRTGAFVTWRRPQSITATRLEGGKGVEILRQTGAVVEIPPIPAFIVARHFAQVSDTRHAVSLRRALVTLGLVPAAELADGTAPRQRTWRDGIDAGMNREVEAVLNLSQVGPFNDDQARVITDWLMAARQVKDWAPDQQALLRRIVLDRRMRTPAFFDQIFERHRDVTEALLPDMLDLLEAHGAAEDYAPERQAANTFARIDPALLAPYAQRILALREKDSKLRVILLPVVGRLGVDPSPYLLPIGRDIVRVRAVCLAETRWVALFIPGLREAVSEKEGTQKLDISRVSFGAAALRTLAKLGDAEFVRQYLAQRDDADAKSLARRIDYELKHQSDTDSPCRD